MQRVCPAGNLAALMAAIDNGADAVYAGFRNQPNARAFAGLNFSDDDHGRVIAYARHPQRKVYLGIRRTLLAGLRIASTGKVQKATSPEHLSRESAYQ